MKVKVGDKIKVVNANISGGRYQNGDVFTVHSVKEYGTVFVKEHDQCVWDSEYEVVKEMPHIKVGDKVKIVSGGGSCAGYENGDVLEVIALSARNPKDIYVRILKDVGYTGRAADRPICQPFAFLIEPDYEVVKEMPKAEIKPGDTVKLIDKFYEHESFKSDERWIRKQIASLKGKEFEVKCFSLLADRVSTDKIHYTIPIELLEKVEPDRPVFEAGKSYVFDKTLLDRKPRPDSWESDADGGSVEFKPGNWGGSVRGYAVVREWCKEAEELPKIEPKPGDLFKVVNKGNGYHNFEIGQVVELVEVERAGTYKLRGYIKRKNEVGNQILYSSDLEPYDGKRRYTNGQVREAQRIIGEIVAGFREGECFYVLDVTTNGIAIRYRTGRYDCYERFDSRCSPNDEFNWTIGLLVAICKAIGRKLPDWL